MRGRPKRGTSRLREAGLLALAVAGIIGTVVGAYYYLKVVKIMYMDEPAEPYGRLRAPGCPPSPNSG